MKELTDLSGKQVSMEGSSKPETENAGDQGTGAAAPIHHAEGIALQKSMQHQASKVGIMVDAIIVDKRMTCTNTFKVISIDDTAAEVKECVLGEVVEPPKTVPMAELMEHFKLSKAKLSSNVPGWPSAALISSPVVCSEVKFDILKGKILDGCTQVYHDHQSVLWGVRVLQNPDTVVASADFKAKELVLVAGAQTVSKKGTNTSISIGMYKMNDKDVELFLQPAGVNLKSGWVSPFWSVQQAAEPNLVLNFKEIDVGGVKVRVPILVNQKKVRKGDVLNWCKDPVKEPPSKKPKK